MVYVYSISEKGSTTKRKIKVTHTGHLVVLILPNEVIEKSKPQPMIGATRSNNFEITKSISKISEGMNDVPLEQRKHDHVYDEISTSNHNKKPYFLDTNGQIEKNSKHDTSTLSPNPNTDTHLIEPSSHTDYHGMSSRTSPNPSCSISHYDSFKFTAQNPVCCTSHDDKLDAEAKACFEKRNLKETKGAILNWKSELMKLNYKSPSSLRFTSLNREVEQDLGEFSTAVDHSCWNSINCHNLKNFPKFYADSPHSPLPIKFVKFGTDYLDVRKKYKATLESAMKRNNYMCKHSLTLRNAFGVQNVPQSSISSVNSLNAELDMMEHSRDDGKERKMFTTTEVNQATIQPLKNSTTAKFSGSTSLRKRKVCVFIKPAITINIPSNVCIYNRFILSLSEWHKWKFGPTCHVNKRTGSSNHFKIQLQQKFTITENNVILQSTNPKLLLKTNPEFASEILGLHMPTVPLTVVMFGVLPTVALKNCFTLNSCDYRQERLPCYQSSNKNFIAQQSTSNDNCSRKSIELLLHGKTYAIVEPQLRNVHVLSVPGIIYLIKCIFLNTHQFLVGMNCAGVYSKGNTVLMMLMTTTTNEISSSLSYTLLFLLVEVSTMPWSNIQSNVVKCFFYYLSGTFNSSINMKRKCNNFHQTSISSHLEVVKHAQLHHHQLTNSMKFFLLPSAYSLVSFPIDAHCIEKNDIVETVRVTDKALLELSHNERMVLNLKKQLLDLGENDLVLLCQSSSNNLFSNLYDAISLFNKRCFDQAIEHLEEIQQVLEARYDSSPISLEIHSLVYYYLGEIEYFLGRFGTAVVYYRKSMNPKTERKVTLHLIPFIPLSVKQEKLALALRANDEISDSILMFKRAIQAKSANLVSCCVELGNLYYSIANYQAAIENYEVAVQLAEKQDDQSLNWIHGNLGNACFSLGRKEKGIHHLKLALDLTYKLDPVPTSISRALNNLGTGYQSFGDHETAGEFYDQALCQAIFAEDRIGQARAYGSIGNLCMAQKDYERAIPHYTEVLNLSNDASVMYVAFHNRGCGYYELAEMKKKQYLSKQIKRHDFHFFGCGPNVKPQYFESVKPESIQCLYNQGLKDLEEVIIHLESTFSGPKQTVNLFFSNFEKNVKTFNRAQDCAYNLGDHRQALLLAEECRSRTLAELMLKRESFELHVPLHSPPTLDHVSKIMQLQEPNVPVVVFSWTGSRLLVWILQQNGKDFTMDMFEQEPSEDLFNGSSFEAYIQDSLNHLVNDEICNIKTAVVEMGENGRTEEANEADESLKMLPITKLYKLVAEPLKEIFACAENSRGVLLGRRKIVIIPDTSTMLIPFASLSENEDFASCFGDDYIVRFMPSLLTLGIISQAPPVEITVPLERKEACILFGGNFLTTSFTVERHELNLGPSFSYAKHEAEWVGHYIKCKPFLGHEPICKDVVISRLKTAKLAHIVIHGSATQITLALSKSSLAQNEERLVLSVSDLKHLSLKIGLVVLSSCDSDKRIIKYESMHRLAQAFLLAGAQSVVTSLWKVPEKSSCLFMQFFYCFLLGGYVISEALNKASCSIRAFEEFSSMIHWSGYQITGKDGTVHQAISKEERLIKKSLGRGCRPFPHIQVVTALRKALIEEHSADIQIIYGSADASLTEPVIDFIILNAEHFSTGIIWMKACTKDIFEKQLIMMQKVQMANETSLIVIDICDASLMDEAIRLVQMYTQVRVIIVLALPSSRQLIDTKICGMRRSATLYEMSALSNLQVTQRLVYHIQCGHHLTPGKEERKALSNLSSMCLGFPVITDIMNSFIDACIVKEEDPCEGVKLANKDFIVTLGCTIENGNGSISRPTAVVLTLLECLYKNAFLTTESRFLLNCLSLFGHSPVPQRAVIAIAEEVVHYANKDVHTSKVVVDDLCHFNLLKRYPDISSSDSCDIVSKLFAVPDIIGDVLHNEVVTNKLALASCHDLILHSIEKLVSGYLSSHFPSSDCLYVEELLKSIKSLVPEQESVCNESILLLEDASKQLCANWLGIKPFDTDL